MFLKLHRPRKINMLLSNTRAHFFIAREAVACASTSGELLAAARAAVCAARSESSCCVICKFFFCSSCRFFTRTFTCAFFASISADADGRVSTATFTSPASSPAPSTRKVPAVALASAAGTATSYNGAASPLPSPALTAIESRHSVESSVNVWLTLVVPSSPSSASVWSLSSTDAATALSAGVIASTRVPPAFSKFDRTTLRVATAVIPSGGSSSLSLPSSLFSSATSPSTRLSSLASCCFSLSMMLA
mmetsp:Transcript_23089/g.53414  ORF Transcript_23089/g.53414 Transcript_23089/m.53414 type:complete len:248 (+) Transcript_23089:434-1177(+)